MLVPGTLGVSGPLSYVFMHSTICVLLPGPQRFRNLPTLLTRSEGHPKTRSILRTLGLFLWYELRTKSGHPAQTNDQ